MCVSNICFHHLSKCQFLRVLGGLGLLHVIRRLLVWLVWVLLVIELLLWIRLVVSILVGGAVVVGT